MKGDCKLFVAVEDCGEPPLGVGLDVCQEWNGQRKIAFWWGEVAVGQCLVDEMDCAAAARFFKAGSHATNGINF